MRAFHYGSKFANLTNKSSPSLRITCAPTPTKNACGPNVNITEQGISCAICFVNSISVASETPFVFPMRFIRYLAEVFFVGPRFATLDTRKLDQQVVIHYFYHVSAQSTRKYIKFASTNLKMPYNSTPYSMEVARVFRWKSYHSNGL